MQRCVDEFLRERHEAAYRDRFGARPVCKLKWTDIQEWLLQDYPPEDAYCTPCQRILWFILEKLPEDAALTAEQAATWSEVVSKSQLQTVLKCIVNDYIRTRASPLSQEREEAEENGWLV